MEPKGEFKPAYQLWKQRLDRPEMTLVATVLEDGSGRRIEVDADPSVPPRAYDARNVEIPIAVERKRCEPAAGGGAVEARSCCAPAAGATAELQASDAPSSREIATLRQASGTVLATTTVCWIKIGGVWRQVSCPPYAC
jgi:hypothetical protein